MMKIEIKTGGASFRNPDGNEDRYYETTEIIRLLKKVIEQLDYDYEKMDGCAMDICGNKALTWERN